jgi:large subunit ribosomal protein L23
MALTIYDIIKRPVVTEKTTRMQEELNQYVFEVDTRANKIQIKHAIEEIFNVDVEKVATIIMPLKRSRRGRKFYQRTPEWKKAIISVPKGQTIKLES